MATQRAHQIRHQGRQPCQGRKVGTKMDFFFPNVPYNLRKRLLGVDDEEAMWSVTRQQDADKISRVLSKYGKTITDMTACIGGNVISFCKFFDHVNAIEMNYKRYSYLKNNVEVLCQSDNVKCHRGDSLKKIQKLEQDILFFDVPWGEKYAEHEKSILTFGKDNTPLGEICRSLLSKAQVIALKLPVNFDYDEFFSHYSFSVVEDIRAPALRKMNLLVVR